MGWKNVKEHYNIVHQVQVTIEGICIGSSYIHNIIVIGHDGTIKKRYDSGRSNDNLRRYQMEMDDDPIKLKELVISDDVFPPQSFTVYTYSGSKIIEKQCEEIGWPNVTHDGLIMYENTFSTDRAEVVAWAVRNAECGVKCWQDRLAGLAKDEARIREHLAEAENDLKTLLRMSESPRPSLNVVSLELLRASARLLTEYLYGMAVRVPKGLSPIHPVTSVSREVPDPGCSAGTFARNSPCCFLESRLNISRTK